MRALKLCTTVQGHTVVVVTTQAHEGIETRNLSTIMETFSVTTQAHEGIEIVEHAFFSYSFTR